MSAPANRRADAAVLPVIAETLEVGRRTVDTGAVRVRKVVHEERVPVDGSRVAQYVETERVPVGRVIESPMPVRQEGDTTIIPVVEERAVVRKELVLVEEVRITRRTRVEQAPQSATVRRESVLVERFDPATQEWRAIEEPGPTGDGGAAPNGTGPGST